MKDLKIGLCLNFKGLHNNYLQYIVYIQHGVSHIFYSYPLGSNREDFRLNIYIYI